MMKLRRALVAAAVAVAGLATVFVVQSANADDTAESATRAAGCKSASTTDGGVAGGYANFCRDGDKLRVCDRDADGHGALAQVAQLYGNPPFYHLEYELRADGEGNCKNVDAGDGAEYDLEEGWQTKVCVFRVKAGNLSDRKCFEMTA